MLSRSSMRCPKRSSRAWLATAPQSERSEEGQRRPCYLGRSQGNPSHRRRSRWDIQTDSRRPLWLTQSPNQYAEVEYPRKQKRQPKTRDPTLGTLQDLAEKVLLRQ